MDNLEEISVHEVNRIGGRFSEDIKTFQENMKKGDEEINQYIELYTKKIKHHNQFIRETNSYLQDHIIKYYRDIKTGDLSYTKNKKRIVGFL